MADFQKYITFLFDEDCEKTVKSKLNQIFKKWNQIMERSKTNSEAINSIEFDILKNRKFKLPWDNTEI